MDTDATAAELHAMRVEQRVVADLDPALRPRDFAAAYAAQDALVAKLLTGADDRTIGYKVACTSAVAQEALRIDAPFYGQLLASSTHRSGVTLDAATFTQRVIEPELGIEIATDVPAGSGPHDVESIAAYVGAVIPSIEVVDHRFVDWADVGAHTAAADNAIHGCWVAGEAFTGDVTTLDLAAHPVTASVNGVEITAGTGANALGHPLNVVAWLADELPRYGHNLVAGDRITTGVVTDVFFAEPGDEVVADFAALGSVSITWT